LLWGLLGYLHFFWKAHARTNLLFYSLKWDSVFIYFLGNRGELQLFMYIVNADSCFFFFFEQQLVICS
jgi:hypothetical protein